MFTPRLTKPEKGNKYYNTIANGGISTAIVGSPTDAGCNVLANCVGYAAGRFNEIIGQNCFVHFRYAPDPDQWIVLAQAEGLRTGSEPQLGAVAVWRHHVAIVEEIHADGSITTSESGYGCANPCWTSKRVKGSGNWSAGSEYRFLGFIYLPEGAGGDVPEGLIRKGDSGLAVTWLQTRLTAEGYLPKGQIDGIFGNFTLGALLAFQFEHGLAVDGICGPATKAALTA